MYNEKVMEAFKNPKNVGEIEDASGVGTVGNASCGDIMQISLKIENDIIVDAKFKTFGCAAAIATSSTATDMIIGMTVEEALKVTNKKVVECLGGLPSQKIHCSVLAEEAIKKAIEDYVKMIFWAAEIRQRGYPLPFSLPSLKRSHNADSRLVPLVLRMA